ncbi:MAG: DinB family protein [Gemmatimonadaceae bacterium]
MRDVLVARWAEIGDKIVTLAEEFPEDKYDAAPAKGARSFADQLRHVAFWNRYVSSSIRGEPADSQANELPRASYPTKDKIVRVLRKTFDEVKADASKRNVTPEVAEVDTLVSFIEHNGEHYGQLAVYFRLNGLVPPASR